MTRWSQRVNGQPEELPVLTEAGSRLPWGGTSRMNREVHVRICGGLGVKVPGSTRPLDHQGVFDSPKPLDCARVFAQDVT